MVKGDKETYVHGEEMCSVGVLVAASVSDSTDCGDSWCLSGSREEQQSVDR